MNDRWNKDRTPNLEKSRMREAWDRLQRKLRKLSKLELLARTVQIVSLIGAPVAIARDLSLSADQVSAPISLESIDFTKNFDETVRPWIDGKSDFNQSMRDAAKELADEYLNDLETAIQALKNNPGLREKAGIYPEVMTVLENMLSELQSDVDHHYQNDERHPVPYHVLLLQTESGARYADLFKLGDVDNDGAVNADGERVVSTEAVLRDLIARVAAVDTSTKDKEQAQQIAFAFASALFASQTMLNIGKSLGHMREGRKAESGRVDMSNLHEIVEKLAVPNNKSDLVGTNDDLLREERRR